MKICRRIQKYCTSTFVFIFLFTQFACTTQNKIGEFKQNIKICNDIQIEVYRAFGSGAYGGDKLTHCLTDSTNFIVLVGSYDNYYEHFSYKCVEDSIIIYFMRKSENDTMFRIKNKNSYSIDNLKKLQNIISEDIIEIEAIK